MAEPRPDRTVDTVDECLKSRHWIIHVTGDRFLCYDCTMAAPTVLHQGQQCTTRVYVQPRPEWCDHVHELVWWGFDGMDQYQICKRCPIHSHDYIAYGRQEEEKRDAPPRG